MEHARPSRERGGFLAISGEYNAEAALCNGIVGKCCALS
jgi:hypothetical protein